MKFKSLALGTAAALLATGNVHADDMTIVSWGGAYSKSQLLAYHQPYMAKNPGVKIINDESSAEAVAKLRAMAEAKNVTWDVVDVVAADALRLCDEGLAIELDADTQLAKAPDGTPASKDFGELLVSKCFIPQIVYSTTFGYRSDVAAWGGKEPTDVCAVFDLKAFPGKRSLEKRPINNMEWALLCDGVAKADIYDVLETTEGQDRAFAKLDTIKNDV
ncbi:MAG: extracellular solute-binding protein, partial [Chromatiales bacterium]|nr:extracellular solute-binding protein [Chromatiales bacterium]